MFKIKSLICLRRWKSRLKNISRKQESINKNQTEIEELKNTVIRVKNKQMSLTAHCVTERSSALKDKSQENSRMKHSGKKMYMWTHTNYTFLES